MKFVTVNDFRTSPSRIWKKLPSEREFVVTDKGKPIALLTPLCDESFEDAVTAIRRAKAITAARRMQEVSVSSGNDKMTLDEINAIIEDSRNGRKK